MRATRSERRLLTTATQSGAPLGMEFSLQSFSSVKYLELIEQIKLGEEIGASACWVNDSAMDRDPYPILAASAVRTERVRLGTCVTNPISRHMGVTARAVSTLNEISGGRALLGLGRGASSLRPLGLTRLTTSQLRDAVGSLKSLLRGEAVNFDSRWSTLREARLSSPPISKVPVCLAATGPNTLRLAGEVADGAIINAGTAPECLTYAIKQVRAGVESARRKIEDVKIFAFVFAAISDDRESTIDEVRPEAAYFVTNAPHLVDLVHLDPKEQGRTNELRKSGLTLHELQGRPGALKEKVSDSLVESFTLAGTPGDCARKVRMMRSAGVDHIIFSLKRNFGFAASSIAHSIMPRD